MRPALKYRTSTVFLMHQGSHQNKSSSRSMFQEKAAQINVSGNAYSARFVSSISFQSTDSSVMLIFTTTCMLPAVLYNVVPVRVLCSPASPLLPSLQAAPQIRPGQCLMEIGLKVHEGNWFETRRKCQREIWVDVAAGNNTMDLL